MADIDVLLSSSLKRIAQPGDAAGVADAIRARVDAGDTGTPATSSGFGGLLPAVSKLLPWVGVIVAVGVAGGIGGAMGSSGMLGTPPAQLPASATGLIAGHVSGLDCPGGAEIAQLQPGQRVLAMERSDDSGYLAVRDPDNLAVTVWLPAVIVIVDEGEPAVSSLPVGGCPVVETLVAEATSAPVPPAPGQTPGPVTPDPGPQPTPDTTSPSLSVGSFSPQPVYGTEAAPYCPTTASVTVTATDDVGIADVSGSADTAGATVQLTGSGGSSYTFEFSAPYVTGSNKVVTVTFIATDSSGNQASAPRTLVLTSAGNCLI